MPYNFETYTAELGETQKGLDLIERYTKVYGSFPTTLEECPFFPYIQSFPEIEYKIPEEISEDFDWVLLLKLVCASFASEYRFVVTEDSLLPELLITVTSGNQTIEKSVLELWSFQVQRLFEIYLNEQFDFSILEYEERECLINKIENDKAQKNKESAKKIDVLYKQGVGKKYSINLDKLLLN
jgi:hypothetical protein